jgi:predicted PurR-regulated permease PerM
MRSILSVPGALLATILGFLVWVLFREIGVIVPLISLAALLWPSPGMTWRGRIVRLIVALGSLWILYKARMVVYPLFFAVLVAYWLDPIVERLARRRIRRSLGAFIAILPAIAIGAAFLIFLVPVLVDQTIQLAGALPGIWTVISDKVQEFVVYVLPAGWHPDLGQILKPLSSHMQAILKGVITSFSTVAKGIGAVLAVIGMIVLAPVLTYYILADFDRFRAWVRLRVPKDRMQGFMTYGVAAEGIFRSYFRGQALVALAVGVFYSVGLTIIGLPYSILLGFIAGLMNLVPVLGFYISLILFVLAAILSGHPGTLLLRLVIVLAAEQAIESQVLVPRIVGRAVGLNPLFTLLSVLVFGAILGPLGILVAVPAAAMIRSFLEIRANR